jgi:hypothetical protein
MLARSVAEQLRQRGWAISLPFQLKISHKSKAEKVRWLLRNGAPWFLKRSVDLLPAALILMVYELVKVIVEKFNPNIETRELAFLSVLEPDPMKRDLLKAS